MHYRYCTLEQLMNDEEEQRPERITLWPNAKGRPRPTSALLSCNSADRVEISTDDIRVVSGAQQAHYIINGHSFGQGTEVRFA